MWNRTEAEMKENNKNEIEEKAETVIQAEMEIYWLRHGKTKSNEEHRYLGKTDEGLTEAETERLQAKKVPEAWQTFPLFSSPMKRCRQTAELLFQKEPLLIPEWVEMDFGLFEGKNYQDLKGDAYYQRWIDSDGTLPFPQGESREAFLQRSRKGLERMLFLLDKGAEIDGMQDKGTVSDRNKMPDKEKIPDRNKMPDKVVAVVHGGTIMAVLSELTGREYFSFQVPNGGGYRTRIRRKQNTIEVLEIEQIEQITD